MTAAFHVRNEWGGTPPQGGALGKVRYIIGHHTAGPGSPFGFDPGRWKQLERAEQAQGYSSLAYHFGLPRGGGHIVESRGWGARGAATGGTAPNGIAWNGTSIAIVIDCYAHPPYNEMPAPQAIEDFADVIVLGVFLGCIDRDFEVWQHRQASAGTQYATACPGDLLVPAINGPFASAQAIARYKLDTAPAGPITPAPAPPGPPRCVNVCSSRVLRRGSSGVCVTTAQRMLAGRGFNPGPQDGQFGAKTDTAVRCFQQAAGLTVDGVVGPQTWAALGG